MKSYLKYSLFVGLIYLIGACKSEPTFKTVTVDFFIEHPDISIEPATFDTLTEIVLVKEASMEGATFETFTEQVLVRDAYRDVRIMDIEVPAEYSFRNFLKVAEAGTGVDRPAEYETREYYRTRDNATVNLSPEQTLEPLRKIFRIPIEMDFDLDKYFESLHG